jgi:hypothetical protein
MPIESPEVAAGAVLGTLVITAGEELSAPVVAEGTS